jgi:hypothetical protein
MLTTTIKRACAAAIIVGAPLLALSPWAAVASPKDRCSVGTLSGIYDYSYTGFTIATDHTQTPFATVGVSLYDGQGNVTGASTTTTTDGKQASAGAVGYNGTYTVTSNCRVRETDTDINGWVSHYFEYTGPNGTSSTFIEIDPNVVATGTETRD